MVSLVVRISFLVLIPFYCVCVISFYFSPFCYFFCGVYYLLKHWGKFVNTYDKAVPMGVPRRIDVNLRSILRRYDKDQISTNFHVFGTYFFDVILLIEKSTLFPLTFFDVILMIWKSTLFARTFFDEISMRKKSMSCLVKLQTLNIWKGFPLLVTLKSWCLEDCSPQTF